MTPVSHPLLKRKERRNSWKSVSLMLRYIFVSVFVAQVPTDPSIRAQLFVRPSWVPASSLRLLNGGSLSVRRPTRSFPDFPHDDFRSDAPTPSGGLDLVFYLHTLRGYHSRSSGSSLVHWEGRK